MAERWRKAGWVVAVGLLAGGIGYAGQFLPVGSSPPSLQLVQL